LIKVIYVTDDEQTKDEIILFCYTHWNRRVCWYEGC